MFYRFGTTPLAIYGKSLLSCNIKLADFGIELTKGRMFLAYAPKDEGVQLLMLGSAEGAAKPEKTGPYTEQVDSAPAIVFKEIEWRLSQKSIDTSGDAPPPGAVVIGAEEPMLISGHDATLDHPSELQAIGLRSGNVYKLTTDEQIRLRAKDWRLDGYVDSHLVVSLFESDDATTDKSPP